MFRLLTLIALATAPMAALGDSLLHAGAAAIPDPLVLVAEGYAAHYGEGVMESTADLRGYPHQFCQVSFTETNHKDDANWNNIGSWLIVESLVTGAWVECQIMDLPRDEHYQDIKDREIVIELGWQATPKVCALSYVSQEPPSQCPVRVWRSR